MSDETEWKARRREERMCVSCGNPSPSAPVCGPCEVGERVAKQHEDEIARLTAALREAERERDAAMVTQTRQLVDALGQLRDLRARLAPTQAAAYAKMLSDYIQGDGTFNESPPQYRAEVTRAMTHVLAALSQPAAPATPLVEVAACNHVGPFSDGLATSPQDRERNQLYNAGFEAGTGHATRRSIRLLRGAARRDTGDINLGSIALELAARAIERNEHLGPAYAATPAPIDTGKGEHHG